MLVAHEHARRSAGTLFTGTTSSRGATGWHEPTAAPGRAPEPRLAEAGRNAAAWVNPATAAEGAPWSEDGGLGRPPTCPPPARRRRPAGPATR
ncbi:hypothetical protein G443_004349 [Actinoalloteichus cyanogriseus DSM 43889]|uniref:Uncharacterized protein n=1 Tax=Actinoalloteichus caeruleus DSM 43889 TaxID=1120930 RepID=A0ABT1JPI2_ACTCY|nr:hypothetical protein [Actinoalloteichus caeruleus DSM 43889]